MSDIIQDAKQLLEGTTPGDWAAIPHDGWDNAKVISPDDEPGVCEIATMCQENYDLADATLMAASKMLASLIGEETWEYSAQAKRGDDWETCTNSETHLEEWWADKGDAEWAAGRLQEQGRETRLVRRRVSPPEVVNE